MLINDKKLEKASVKVMELLEKLELDPLEKIFVLAHTTRDAATLTDMRYRLVEKPNEEVADSIRNLLESVLENGRRL